MNVLCGVFFAAKPQRTRHKKNFLGVLRTPNTALESGFTPGFMRICGKAAPYHHTNPAPKAHSRLLVQQKYSLCCTTKAFAIVLAIALVIALDGLPLYFMVFYYEWIQISLYGGI